MKKFISLLLALVMLIGVTQGISMSAFADETNPYWVKVGADISKSSLTTSNAKTLVQNNSTSETEQLTITADGKKLKISGKTSLAPLPNKTGYNAVYVTSFKNLNGNTYGAPYISMTPVKKTDSKGKAYYTFSGEYDMSSVANGTYKMYLWRGYKEANRNYYYMGGTLSKVNSSLNPGILHYADVIKVTNGNVEVIKYNQIVTANTNAYKAMNVYDSDNFTDASLADFVFANKDPKKSGDKGAPLTQAQQTYIKNIVVDITKNDKTVYDKVKSIYKYVSANLYYDDKRPGNVGTNSANSNPYVNLKGIQDKSTNNYNIYSGKVATNCVGYTSMVAAMARSLNIPTRIVNGVHISDTSWSKAPNNLNVSDHHWAECYVNGKWIMVDANMGNQNHYNGSVWTYTGLTNYAFFDATIDEISTNYIVKAVYYIDAVHTHSYNNGKITKAATCTANGTKTYTCTGCGTTKTETIKATGHSYDAGKVTKAPTVTATGVKTYTCTKCGAKKTETIKATGLKKPTLKAIVNANGSFKLSWGKVTGAEKYELYIKQSDGSYKLMKTTTGTSFTTGTAVYGKQYTYKMRAVKGKTKSAYSSAVNAKNTKKLQTPKLKATVNANGSFKLSWNKITGATSYKLYIKQSDGSYKLMKTTTGTSFTTGTAVYGKQYTYKVRAFTSKNSSATSAYSAAVNAKNTKKLQTPKLKATVNKNGSFKLSWGKVAGATSYQIYMKQANGKYKLIKKTTAASFKTAVAKKGKTYTYKIRAVTSKNSKAASNYSNVVNAKRK